MSVSPTEPDFRPQVLLETLRRRSVDFVVVGGLAAMAHGSSYPSFDVDIVYARDHPNLDRLAAALRELQATLRGAPPEPPFRLDAATIEAGAHFTFTTKYGALDVLDRPDGAPAYDELRRRALATVIEGETVLVASIDHMIAMKEATVRPHDKTVAAELRAISDELRAKDPATEATTT
jgi:hypothetical protein